MDTFQALYERRSIREFERGKVIPEEVVKKILESALYAPAAPGYVLPWRMLVARDKDTKDIFADFAKETAHIMFGASFEVFGSGHLWYLPKDTQLAVAEYTVTGELWEYPRDSDITVVPILSKGGWQDTITAFTDDVEMLAQFIGFASQNMWLVAHKYGVGAGYNAMPCLDVRRRELVVEHLGIPWSWEPTGAFSFGYPSVPRYFGPARPALEGVVFSEYWGNPYQRVAFRKRDYPEVSLPPMDIEEAIKKVGFVRHFQPGPIGDEIVEKVIDAAIWGPVPENFKNWRFLVVRDRESKEFLKSLVAEKRHSPWFHNYPELQYSRLQHIPAEDRVEKMEEVLASEPGAWIPEADAVIVVLSCYLNWRDQVYEAIAPGPNPPFAVSTGCCTQNMMIAAAALGLGLNYDVLAGGDMRTRELLLEYFGIPAASWLPQGILGLGRPGEREELPPRPPLSSLVYDEYWGNNYKF